MAASLKPCLLDSAKIPKHARLLTKSKSLHSVKNLCNKGMELHFKSETEILLRVRVYDRSNRYTPSQRKPTSRKYTTNPTNIRNLTTHAHPILTPRKVAIRSEAHKAIAIICTSTYQSYGPVTAAQQKSIHTRKALSKHLTPTAPPQSAAEN